MMRVPHLPLAFSLITTIIFGYARVSAADAPEKADSLILGNGNRSIVSYETVYSENNTGGSALYYPESTMQMYKGCKITSFNLALANYKTTESVTLFITHSLDGAYDYVQEVIPSKSSWNRVALSTPFELDGSAVFIGYIIKGTGATVLSYTNVIVKNEEWINQRDNTWAKYSNGSSAGFYAIVEGDNLPLHNVRLTNVKMPNYTLTGNAISFEGDITNLGAENVQNLSFISNAGDIKYTATIDNLNIKPRETQHLSISGLTMDSEGAYDLTLTASAVNNVEDQDPTDNSSRTVSLTSRNNFVARKVLLEMFSTEKCNNCPTAHKYVSNAIEGDPNIIEMVHHSAFYTDRLTIDASVAYEWFYDNRLYAPAIMLDRTNHADNYPEFYGSSKPVTELFSDKNGFPQIRSLAASTPALASIRLTGKKTDARTFSIHVEGERLLPIPENANSRLFVFVTEDSVFSVTQSGSLRNYYHRNAARMCISGTWGTSIDLAKGYAEDYDFTIADTCNMEKMRVIAFVSNYNDSDHNDCNVYNTEALYIKDIEPVGVNGIEADDNGFVTFDGRTLRATRKSNVEIFTPGGQCVNRFILTGNDSFDTGSLSSGCYILHAACQGKHKSFKVIR